MAMARRMYIHAELDKESASECTYILLVFHHSTFSNFLMFSFTAKLTEQEPKGADHINVPTFCLSLLFAPSPFIFQLRSNFTV